MRAQKNSIMLWTIGVVGLFDVALGCLLPGSLVTAGGSVGLCYLFWRLTDEKPFPRVRIRRRSEVRVKSPTSHVPPGRKPVDPNDTDALVEQMLAQGRCALLLRPEIAQNLDEEQLQRVKEALEEQMALVPEGDVVLGRIDEATEDGKLEEEEIEACNARVIRVELFFLDRYPVTNREYYEFVAAGGYGQMAVWDESIMPAVLDFVDRTGVPGPRQWKDGCFEPGLEDHPVVGVSWYEATAFARWVGKRLPTDAEWVKAGSWPVPVEASTRLQRKYPWGDTMDRSRTNLWGSGPDTTTPVDSFAKGVSVGGVYQLIGNVWEWTSGDFRAAEHTAGELIIEVPTKSIRGGAFDTYFDNQATCQFQSGEASISRKPNIGFRCAVGVCDLDLFRASNVSAAPDEELVPSVEEVLACPRT